MQHPGTGIQQPRLPSKNYRRHSSQQTAEGPATSAHLSLLHGQAGWEAPLLVVDWRSKHTLDLLHTALF